MCFAFYRRVKNTCALPFNQFQQYWKATLAQVPFLHRPPSHRITYLISTFAPAASIFFLISSASCLVTPSLSVLGAPSTSAFASARPSPGTAPRTSLMTAILFAPISCRTTSNVVFSSAAGAAAPPAAPAPAGPAAIATGAAALTPHFSSSCFTNPAISSTDKLLSCSTKFSVSAICLFFLQLPPLKAFRELKPVATDPDSSVSLSVPRLRAENFLKPSLARTRPPFLLWRSRAAL